MRDSQLGYHIPRQKGREDSLACVFLVIHKREVCGYGWGAVRIPWWSCQLFVGNANGVRECIREVSLAIAVVGLWVGGLYVLQS